MATNTQFLGGEQINQGLELNVFGGPIDGVRLLGGAMLLSVLDANYWAGGNGANRLFLSVPRTFRLSLTADF